MIKFLTDHIRIYGPKVDGSYKIELSVGEYETEALAEIIKLDKQQTTTITMDQK